MRSAVAWSCTGHRVATTLAAPAYRNARVSPTQSSPGGTSASGPPPKPAWPPEPPVVPGPGCQLDVREQRFVLVQHAVGRQVDDAPGGSLPPKRLLGRRAPAQPRGGGPAGA